MKLSLAVLFVAFGMVFGDVAHLGRNYLPPDRERLVALPQKQGSFGGSRLGSFTAGTCFSERLTQAAPVSNYIAPDTSSSSSFTSRNSAQSFSAPERLTLAASPNYPRPAVQSFNAPAFAARAPVRVPAPARLTSAQLALPSQQYSSPETETFEPITVKQSYSAPVTSYIAPANSIATAALTAAAPQSDTKYSPDGGYVY